MPLVSLALAFVAYKIGIALKLDYAAKLFAITFVLGAPTALPLGITSADRAHPGV